METYYSRNKEKRKQYLKEYRAKNKEKLKAYNKEYIVKTKEKRKENYDKNKYNIIEQRKRERYWQAFDLIKKFENKGWYVPQYELKPETINENRVFTKEDFEYIKSMSNKQYPSIERTKNIELQKYNIKVKYADL